MKTMVTIDVRNYYYEGYDKESDLIYPAMEAMCEKQDEDFIQDFKIRYNEEDDWFDFTINGKFTFVSDVPEDEDDICLILEGTWDDMDTKFPEDRLSIWDILTQYTDDCKVERVA